MKNKFISIFMLFVLGFCFSISIDEALKKVYNLQILSPGEQLNYPTPAVPITYGNKKYWVIEIDQGNNIYFLVVVDDDGDVVYGNYAKEIMKIYYINHYFYKQNNPLKQFFDSISDQLVSIKNDLDTRITNYDQIKEANNLDLEDRKCLNYIKKTDNEINKIVNDINSINYNLISVDQIMELKENIFLIFKELENFLDDLNTAKQKCGEYIPELVKKYKNNSTIYQIIILLTNYINLNSYTDVINSWNYDLKKNEKVINKTFNELNNVVDQFYQRFLERINETKLGKEKKEKLKILMNLTYLFNYIKKHDSFLKEYEKKKIEELWSMYNKTYYNVLDYNFKDFDENYNRIKTELESYKEKIDRRIKEYQDEIKKENNNNNSLNQYIIVVVLGIILGILMYMSRKKKKKEQSFYDIDFDPFKM